MDIKAVPMSCVTFQFLRIRFAATAVNASVCALLWCSVQGVRQADIDEIQAKLEEEVCLPEHRDTPRILLVPRHRGRPSILGSCRPWKPKLWQDLDPQIVVLAHVGLWKLGSWQTYTRRQTFIQDWSHARMDGTAWLILIRQCTEQPRLCSACSDFGCARLVLIFSWVLCGRRLSRA